MNPTIRQLTVLLLPLFLLAACASGRQHTTRLLNERMQARLAQAVADGKVVVQQLPDGTRVTLLGSGSFPDDKQAVDDAHPDPRANVVEALLAPPLMRIQLADTSGLPADQRAERVQNVARYLTDFGLGDTLEPVSQPQTAAVPWPPAPAGLVITVNVYCPPRRGGVGYGNGEVHPVCD